MSNRKSMVLGYTRSGHEVFLPTPRSPDTDTFTGWTRGDHVDASRILKEHGERERDPEAGSRCRRWAKIHRVLRKSARAPLVRGAAEISIKVRGSR